MRSRFALALVAVLAAAGCGRSGPFDGLGGGGAAPTPDLPGGPGETPIPTPGLALPYGDGHDGDLVVAGTETVNACAPLLTGSNGSVTLGLVPPQITVGTVILAWQVQSEFASVGDQSDMTDVKDAGRWELTRVAAVNGNVLTVYPALAGAYLSGGALRAQACNVPEFRDVTVALGSSIEGVPWTGGAGGLVAFFANGSVTIGGTVHADGIGFRGGSPSNNSTSTNIELLDSTNPMEGGGKGEGLDPRGLMRFAAGNCANGGGGGNAARAGGGGGANGGPGGRGGREMSGQGDDNESRGLPGARVDVTDGRLLPGGGGGGGHQALGTDATGGRGGGVVLLMVKALGGIGTISANGARGLPLVPVADGAGGGGAGGMVRLSVEDATSFDGDLDAIGGDGAETIQGGGGSRYGPGGGGGGGWVLWSSELGGSAGIDVDPGDNGQADGDDWGASNGGTGVEVPPS